jgi:hypothetical protein
VARFGATVRVRLLSLIVALAAVAAPACAEAATVTAIRVPTDKGSTATMRFSAAPGEANDVTYRGTIVDRGAPLTAGEGCRQVSEHEVSCDFHNNTSFDLGDGDDRIVLEGQAGVYGGAGDDEITGSFGSDGLGGGPGRDTIRAGAGNDSVSGDVDVPFADVLDGGEGTDSLSYQVAAGVRVDLSNPAAPAGAQGEGDSQTGFEDVHAFSDEPSELIGDDGRNRLRAPGRGSHLVGGGETDILIAGLDAVVDGGPAADGVAAGPGARMTCGDGDDLVVGNEHGWIFPVWGHIAPDCERLPLRFFEGPDSVIRANPTVRGSRATFRIPCWEFASRRHGCRGRTLLRDESGRRIGKRSWRTRAGRTPAVGVALDPAAVERMAAPGGLVARVSILAWTGRRDRGTADYSITLAAP